MADIEDAASEIASGLAELLNYATSLGVAVTPFPDEIDDPTYSVDGRTAHTVAWDRENRTWIATAD